MHDAIIASDILPSFAQKWALDHTIEYQWRWAIVCLGPYKVTAWIELVTLSSTLQTDWSIYSAAFYINSNLKLNSI